MNEGIKLDNIQPAKKLHFRQQEVGDAAALPLFYPKVDTVACDGAFKLRYISAALQHTEHSSLTR